MPADHAHHFVLDGRNQGACKVCGQPYVAKHADLGWHGQQRGRRNKRGGRIATRAETAQLRESTAAIQSAQMAVGPHRRYSGG